MAKTFLIFYIRWPYELKYCVRLPIADCVGPAEDRRFFLFHRDGGPTEKGPAGAKKEMPQNKIVVRIVSVGCIYKTYTH
jgi:hypothetical protein